MKITLVGSSQLTLSIAWGICHSEIAQHIVFYPGTQSGRQHGNNTQKHSQSLVDNIEDLTLSSAMSASDTTVTYSNTCEDISDSDVVVLLPAALPYGFRTLQALKTTNLSIVRKIIPRVIESTQNAIIIVAMPFANYISSWIHQTQSTSNIIGVINGISTAHLKAEIAKQLGISVKDIAALSIGNDEVIYALPQYCRINGVPLSQLTDESTIHSITAAVEKRCAYTSTSEYTLVSHILQVLSAIGLDKKRVMSVGTLISTDTTSVFINVPCKIGSKGIESIVPLELTESQTEQFKHLVSQSATSHTF